MSNPSRRILAVPAALLATALLIGTASANHIFRADARPISAAQEVPTNGSAGIGTVTAIQRSDSLWTALGCWT